MKKILLIALSVFALNAKAQISVPEPEFINNQTILFV